MKKIFITFFLSCLVVFIPVFVYAYTASSSTYGLESDSVNSGGTSFSTSTTYTGGDTLGEVATGDSTSTTYTMGAGYWSRLYSNVYISLSSTGNVSLGPISGITGGTATGSAAYLVTTNNAAGYQLTVAASTTPAMKSASSSIPDYVPAGAPPDYSFTIASTTDSRFGFSPQGSDIVARFKDNGGSCNTGSSDSLYACWDGFSTTPAVVAQGNGPNSPNGATTTIIFEVKTGATAIIPAQNPSSDYNANVTVTAVTL